MGREHVRDRAAVASAGGASHRAVSMRTRLGAAAAAMLLAMSVAGTSGLVSAQEPGGTATVGVVGATGAYDPHGWSGFTSNLVNNHIYQGLVRLNFETNELEPALAESWENPDPTTYIYHLRDAQFHDGTPVTADDVVFSVERAKELSWGAYGLTSLESVTAIDDKTVEVKLSDPDWRFQYFFYWPPGSILSREYFERVGEAEATQNPIGTNAFRLASSSESEIVLERFEEYWEEDLPELDRVVIRVLDPTTIVTGLRTGEIQYSPDVGFDQLGFVDEFENVDVTARVGPHLVLTAFNLEMEPFNDVKVRQAIAEALDNEAALAAFPEEFYLASTGPMIHPSWQYSAYDELKDHYTGDLEKARALLAESSAPDGFDVTWTVASTRPQELAAVLGAQQRLAELGINVTIEQIPDPDVAGRLYTRPRPFEMITYNWLHNQPNALDPIAAQLTSANLGGTNWAGYDNPRFDELVHAASVATDEADIAAAMLELQQLAIEDVPILIHGWDGIRRVSTVDLETPPQTVLGQWDDWFRVSSLGSE